MTKPNDEIMKALTGILVGDICKSDAHDKIMEWHKQKINNLINELRAVLNERTQ